MIIENFPMSPCSSFGWLVCHNSLKGREFHLLCFYRSTW